MNKSPLLIGITGGIGAGKSVVCKIFESLGIPAYNADQRAKWLMNNDETLISEIKNLFGEESYSDSGLLNRQFIAQKAFHNTEVLEKLNALVHPKVAEDFAVWVTANADSPYLLKEAALLFESGAYKTLDAIINVTAPEDLRIERTLLRDSHRTKDDVKAIVAKQLNEDQRNKQADFVLFNDGKKMLIPQVTKLHNLLLEKSCA